MFRNYDRKGVALTLIVEVKLLIKLGGAVVELPVFLEKVHEELLGQLVTAIHAVSVHRIVVDRGVALGGSLC